VLVKIVAWLSPLRGFEFTIPCFKTADDAAQKYEAISGGFVAHETVSGEPVCGGRFPANRENNREFYKNWTVWRNFTRKSAAKSVSCRAIPYKMKQGINSRRTGNLLSRAGNLQRLAGNCPPRAGISLQRGGFVDGPKKSSEAVDPPDQGPRRKRFRDNPIQAMRVKKGGKGRPATRRFLTRRKSRNGSNNWQLSCGSMV
jgi:hypothetical protein